MTMLSWRTVIQQIGLGGVLTITGIYVMAIGFVLFAGAVWLALKALEHGGHIIRVTV